MSMNIYEVTKANTVLFRADDEVNSLMFDLVSGFQSEQATAKDRAEKCYAIANAPCFKSGAKCEGYKPAEVVAKSFGKLLSEQTFKKYVLTVGRFLHSETEYSEKLKEVYATFQIGKLVQLSALESEANIKSGHHVYAFFCSLGSAVNDKVEETYSAWEEKNATTLEQIAKLRDSGMDDIADNMTALLTNEPPKPARLAENPDFTEAEQKEAEDDYYNTLFYMGLDIVKKLSDSELSKRVSEYAPKAKKANAQRLVEQQRQQQNQPKPKTLAELKADAAYALAAYIIAAEEQGEAVQKSVKNVAEKLKAEAETETETETETE